MPPAIRKAEKSASLRLLFCVDVSGRPYNIKVTQESPTGLGLGEAGIEALKKLTFRPAIKDAQAVPFCGMEQPVEIKFRN
jgi:protein TonB